MLNEVNEIKETNDVKDWRGVQLTGKGGTLVALDRKSHPSREGWGTLKFSC
jgi:hypothetical protein